MTGRKKIDTRWLVLVCVIAVMGIVIAGVALMLRGDEVPGPDQTQAPGTSQQHTGPAAHSLPGESEAGSQAVTGPGEETASAVQTSPAQATQPNQPTQPTTSRPKPTDPVIQAPETIPQQKEATYEQWLAASMVIGISMEYPDFELQGIYLTGETAMEDRLHSDGVYILFTSGAQNLALHGSPLEAGRKTPGTMDLSAQAIGFAAFDPVDRASVNTASMTAVGMEDLDALIAQSMLVSVYWN